MNRFQAPAAAAFVCAALFAAAPARAADNPIYNSETDLSVQRLDPEAAAKSFTVPEGFKVQVFAAEPDVQNPIAMAWDGRGRLWIAENYTYAERPKKLDLALRDRILIFTDSDGDGKHDKREVFTEDLQALTGVEVGTDGIWAMAPPRLLFIPDKNHDDIPDGPAVTVLDGFDIPAENFHNFANGIKFGPDGWLYGRCGGSAPGLVGKPGTPAEERIPLRGGIWRCHPETHVYESLCHGTTNPWGHDWNALGELFFVNTVNGHLWHMIPGAHFVRLHTVEPNARAYQPIDQHADHYHWDNSKDWTDSRGAKGKHDDLGGGHAHIGATIYQGNNWPDQYRGSLLTLNQHGRRVNVDRLDQEGGGWVGKHTPDILKSGDPWFRGIDLSTGPDGSVFIIDWSDTGECHDNTGVHRSSGRIFKVTYGDPKPLAPPDLSKADTVALLLAHTVPNEWFARAARRELLRRQNEGRNINFVIDGLDQQLSQGTDVARMLRALWTLWCLDALTPTELDALLDHPDPSIRLWAVRLLTDKSPLDMATGKPRAREASLDQNVRKRITELAEKETSPAVRLVLASTLQRFPIEARPRLAAALLAHSEDADDHNIPLMIWYGIGPLADESPASLAILTSNCQMPLVRRFITRALAERLDKDPQPVNRVLENALRAGPEAQKVVVFGLQDGLAGWPKAKAPDSWKQFRSQAAASNDENLNQRLSELDALFGDGRAVDSLRQLALDNKVDMNRRISAVNQLIQQKDPELRSVCEKLLSVRFLNKHAIAGLATYDDPQLGVALSKSYKNFHGTERPALLDALVSRASFVPALLDRMEKGEIPKSELSASQARQIVSLGNPSLNERLSKVWGDVRESSAEAQADIARWKKSLTPDVLAKSDMGHGRAVFNKVCANCHRLHGFGAEIGPDLTGSGRQNIDYLLGNILAPADVVPVDFRLSLARLTDGRVVSGIKLSETDKTVTLQTATAKATIAKADIEEMKTSNLSLMPDGLLKTLADDDVKNLIAYLQHPTQVPLE